MVLLLDLEYVGTAAAISHWAIVVKPVAQHDGAGKADIRGL